MAVHDWIEAARPKTLPAAVAPVIIGTAAAYDLGSGSIPRALLAAGVALALQIAVNFANDYSDGIRGTDDVRTGPPRLTGGGKAAPQTVKYAAFACFAVAAVLGLILVAISSSWILLLAGAAAVVAAWYYTGGKNPYGYMGLGEVFVFIFFGLLATLGTTWTQAGALSPIAWCGAIGVGLIACALLMVNNIRDIPTDSQVGKKTLAVRLGQRNARLGYVAMVVAPLVLACVAAIWNPWALLTLVTIPLVYSLAKRAMTEKGLALIPVLRDTGFYELGYALALVPIAF